jgi:uncharacterized protein (TIGR02001 family)
MEKTKMKTKLQHYAIALMMGMGMLSVSAPAQAGDMEISSDLGVYSQYVWRGAQFSGGAASVQGDFGTSFTDNLSANVWFASYPGNATEFDYTVDFSGEAGDVGYSVGVIAYRFLNQKADNTLEVYAGVSFGPVGATLYYDTDANKKDMYLEVSAGTDLAGFATSATVGYAMPDAGKKEVSVVTLDISKDIEMNGVTVTPSFAYNIGLGPNKGVTAANGNVTSKGDQMVAGINFSY